MVSIKKLLSFLLYANCVITFFGCREDQTIREVSEETKVPALFTLLPSESTGISFDNTLTEGLNTNVLMYEYFYNGGGAAAGDINGDGLIDLYFSGNMVENRLYLNKGSMQFQDITETAGVYGKVDAWATGVSMADVNGDGLLDMYVCYSGNFPPEKRKNQLFINTGNNDNGIPVFKDQAEEYGLAHPSFSTHSAFFDYDLDGDLDMFLLNHSPHSLPILDEAGTKDLLSKSDSLSGVRLFQNNRNFFTDVTEKAGIQSSPLTYGLGIGISDLNNDGFPDMYISNDYSIPDFLYINKGDGTFTDQLKAQVGQNSHFSMGNDVADMNNDGLSDIFTLDMLPEDNKRQKLLLAPDNYELHNLNVKVGYHHQFMRNMLQLNNGNGSFSEIGQMAGISNTDWSWAPLFADFDNDGWKDLFVTNGYVRDYTNMDFLKYKGDFIQNLQNKGKVMRKDILELVDKMPSSNVTNYIYKNNGHLSFTNKSKKWGINIPSNSNGAVYADLDGDGDQDLVVNNINQKAFIYLNEASQTKNNHFLQVQLEGERLNTLGIGAKVFIYQNGSQQFLEQFTSRGYQSSISPVLHFGLGTSSIIDSVKVVWPNGMYQVRKDVKADQVLVLKEKEANTNYLYPKYPTGIFKEVQAPIAFHHQSLKVNDFKRQPLMIHPMSFFGPCMAKGDVNADGIEDLFVGGGVGQEGVLMIGLANGKFSKSNVADFASDKMSDDVDALFFDSNRDGFPDLYVVSGGYSNFAPEDSLLQDRLYLNDGKGHFKKNPEALPQFFTSNSCVRETDIDGDGFPDLFVGARVIPGRYPEIPSSTLLINDGKGNFKNQTTQIAPFFTDLGMVSDAAWVDLDDDTHDELIVVGEWMPIKIYKNSEGILEDRTLDFFTKEYNGFWNKILVEDFNGDGKPDMIVGNLGLNAQCKASKDEPAEMLAKDFDGNGSVDPIFSFYIQGKISPYVTRDELLDQMSIMRTRFKNYESYSEATIDDIFSKDELVDALYFKVDYQKTAYFESRKDTKYKPKELPVEVQLAPIFTITSLDYNKDGKQDLLLCGNVNNGRLRFGKSDANYGTLLKGDGQGNFSYVPQRESGLILKGDVRSAVKIDNQLIFGINQEPVKVYQLP